MADTKTSERMFNAFLYIILTLAGLLTLYPFVHIIALSFNDAIDAVAGGIHIWPRVFTLRNYVEVFSYPALVVAFMNSVLRTVIGTVLGVVGTAMIAYTLSRKDFVAAKVFTTLFVITMYVHGGIIPTYILMRDLSLINNFMVYILPGLIGTFGIFIIRSYIDGLPFSLQESAMLDGANEFQIFIRIIFPLCRPVVATIALMTAVNHWNSWFDTYLYCSTSPHLTTLQYELQRIIQNVSVTARPDTSLNPEQLAQMNKVTPQSVQMAVTVIVTTPILMIYPFLQSYFVKGMTLGAVKA